MSTLNAPDLNAPDPPHTVHPRRIDTFNGFLDYLDSWGDSVQRAVWQNTLNTPRKAHMHAYMTTLMPDNLTAALDAGLTTGIFTLKDAGNWFSAWVGNQNMRQPTDRAALSLIARWIYHRTVSPLA